MSRRTIRISVEKLRKAGADILVTNPVTLGTDLANSDTIEISMPIIEVDATPVNEILKKTDLSDLERDLVVGNFLESIFQLSVARFLKEASER